MRLSVAAILTARKVRVSVLRTWLTSSLGGQRSPRSGRVMPYVSDRARKRTRLRGERVRFSSTRDRA